MLSETKLTNNLDLAHPKYQAERRERMLQLHRKSCHLLFDADAKVRDGSKPEWRLYVWHPISLLQGDASHIRLGNAMLRHVATQENSGHFWSSAISIILARFANQLDPDLRATLTARLGDMVEGESKQRYRGYNDNYPSMAALTTLVGGPATGRTECVQGGLDCLESLRKLLTRRGVLSEFCSPTYTAITLSCLADIVELSPYADARDLARQAEYRVWADLMSRFHPATSFLAGPFSRAYTVDLCGHLHNAHVVLYQVLGDSVVVNPTNHLYPPIEGQLLHHGSAMPLSAHVAWHMSATYHVPPEAIELALCKTYPCTVRASAEQAAYPRNFWLVERHPRTPTAEFAAGAMNIYSYLAQDFAFGISDRQFLDGAQYTPFHAVYTRNTPVQTQRDVGTLFSRFIIDGKAPESVKHIADEGRALGVAHGSTAMLLYQACPDWGYSSQIDYNATPVGSLKLSMVVPCQWRRPDEIWLGEHCASAWKGQSEEPVSVYLRDGNLFVALHPLLGTNYGRKAAVKLEEFNNFGLISFYSFEGARRTFSDAELLACNTGFVVELASANDWANFAAFRAFHSQPQISDVYVPDDGMRLVSYQRQGLLLEMDISPVSNGIKCAAANGKMIVTPQFSIDGFDVTHLPWLG